MDFAGFPRGTRFTPVPNPLFGPLLEGIDDLAELRCTLRVVWMLHQKKGFPRYLASEELRSDATLAKLMGDTPEERRAGLSRALAAAVGRGTLISGAVRQRGRTETVYALNTDAERKWFQDNGIAAAAGEIASEDGPEDSWAGAVDRPNVYSLYEQNIGMLTPMIADELRKAEEDYLAEWIEDAIREAVAANARSWRYVSRILERWEFEGKDDGRPEGHLSKAERESYY